VSTESKVEQARQRAADKVLHRLRRFASPIEELFYWSLVARGWPEVEFYTNDYDSAVDYQKEFPDTPRGYAFARGMLCLGYPDVKTMGVCGSTSGFWFIQLGVGKYKLDLAFVGCNDDDVVREMFGSKDIKIAIELDGHDFHERTKEQAQHDKERDRWLLEAGWFTVRYTGSEVYRDADACVDNLFDIIRSLTPRATHEEVKAFVAAQRVGGS
jgi:REase_MTES_1575